MTLYKLFPHVYMLKLVCIPYRNISYAELGVLCPKSGVYTGFHKMIFVESLKKADPSMIDYTSSST